MKKKTAQLAAAVALTVTAAVGAGAIPAHASRVTNPATCGSGIYCSYRDNSFLGGQISSSGYIAKYSSLGFNDLTSSIANHRSFRTLWYADADGLGDIYCLPPNIAENNLSAAWNDRISSSNSGSSYTVC